MTRVVRNTTEKGATMRTLRTGEDEHVADLALGLILILLAVLFTFTTILGVLWDAGLRP